MGWSIYQGSIESTQHEKWCWWTRRRRQHKDFHEFDFEESVPLEVQDLRQSLEGPKKIRLDDHLVYLLHLLVKNLTVQSVMTSLFPHGSLPLTDGHRWWWRGRYFDLGWWWCLAEAKRWDEKMGEDRLVLHDQPAWQENSKEGEHPEHPKVCNTYNLVKL